MNPDHLPASLRAAIESAGYRVVRWAAAREVLSARVTKGRVAGDLGAFLQRWMPISPPVVSRDAFRLVFNVAAEHAWLCGGDFELVSAPPECGLLHLPALRSFWRNELRQEHFEALKRVVPPAWFMDHGKVPPGAVIHGLGITGFERLDRMNHDEWEAGEGVLSRKQPSGERIVAQYGRDNRGKVVLRSLEAAS
jgi:hypothetical protein